MDLIGHHHHVIGKTQLCHRTKFALCPRSAGWVVGVAENEQPKVWIGQLLLEVLEVNGVLTVVGLKQPAGHQLMSMFGGSGLEGAVRRAEREDLLARLHYVFDKVVDGRHDASRGHEVFPFRNPLVVPLAPPGEGVIQRTIEQHGVAEDRTFDPLSHRVDRCRRRCKGHIGHPHHERIIVCAWHDDVFAIEQVVTKTICGNSVRAPAIDDLVEVEANVNPFVLHQSSLRSPTIGHYPDGPRHTFPQTASAPRIARALVVAAGQGHRPRIQH